MAKTSRGFTRVAGAVRHGGEVYGVLWCGWTRTGKYAAKLCDDFGRVFWVNDKIEVVERFAPPISVEQFVRRRERRSRPGDARRFDARRSGW